MNSIDIELLRELTDYDSETGSMTWKERDIRHFKSQHRCDIWNNRFAGKECGYIIKHGYKQTEILGTLLLVHRAAFAHYHGYWPKKQIDHIDHNTSNNSILNLRDTGENDKNQSKQSNNTSGYTGVSLHKGTQKWKAEVGGKYLGLFEDVELAGFVAELTRDKLGYHENHGR